MSKIIILNINLQYSESPLTHTSRDTRDSRETHDSYYEVQTSDNESDDQTTSNNNNNNNNNNKNEFLNSDDESDLLYNCEVSYFQMTSTSYDDDYDEIKYKEIINKNNSTPSTSSLHCQDDENVENNENFDEDVEKSDEVKPLNENFIKEKQSKSKLKRLSNGLIALKSLNGLQLPLRCKKSVRKFIRHHLDS